MKLGSNDIGSVYLGTNAVQKVYLGTNEVWSAGPPTPLLDDYQNAAAAYSLRLLRTAYTGDAIEVRIDTTGQPTYDIGFVDGELDVTTLEGYCTGGLNAYVTKWYDQSGNGKDATQTTASNQPQIVSSGSVILLNGKPAIESATSLKLLKSTGISYNECYISVVFNRTGRAGSADCLYVFENSPFNQVYSNSTDWRYFSGGANNTTIPLSTNQKLMTQIDNGSNTLFYDNNSLDSTFAVSNNISNNTLNLFAIQTSYGMLGKMQEFILYASDKSSDRTGINTNINDFYSIY